MRIVQGPPSMINKTDWERWEKLFKSSVREVAPSLTLLNVINDIKRILTQLILAPQEWMAASYACLDLYWSFLDQVHKTNLPKQTCQQSGRCCMRQTPRVSIYELERINIYAQTSLAPDLRQALIDRLKQSVLDSYQDPITGAGAPCPMLVKDVKTQKHICLVHPVRPMVCRAIAVSKPNSTDCPIWKEGKFPVLPPEIVKPFLELFSWCRTQYAKRLAKDEDCKRQMYLIPVGLLGLMRIPFMPNTKQPEVMQAFPFIENGYDENLYIGQDSQFKQKEAV